MQNFRDQMIELESELREKLHGVSLIAELGIESHEELFSKAYKALHHHLVANNQRKSVPQLLTEISRKESSQSRTLP